MKTYDEDIAKMCKAVREDDETTALNVAMGLLADFMNVQQSQYATLVSMNAELTFMRSEIVSIRNEVKNGMD